MTQASPPSNPDEQKESRSLVSEIHSIKLLSDTTRHRVAKEILSSTLALFLGLLSLVVGSVSTLDKIGISRYLYVSIAVALGTGLLVSLATYLVKRLATQKMDTDRLRNALEEAYFRALDRSILNPKSPQHFYGQRTN